MSPLNIDPDEPALPVTSPNNYAAKIARKHGLMKTVGWWHDTWALNEEKIDEGVFLDDLFRTTQTLEDVTLDELKNDPPSLLVSVFTSTDSVSHMFYRLIDPQHPRYDPELAKQVRRCHPARFTSAWTKSSARWSEAMKPERAVDHRLRSRLSHLAQGFQHQHLAGGERLHDAQESERQGEQLQSRRAVRPRQLFPQRRLEPYARLCAGPRPDLPEFARPRKSTE